MPPESDTYQAPPAEGEEAPPAEDTKTGEESEPKSGKVEFTPPKEFTLPEGSNAPGDRFDSVVTLEVDEDGKLCLVKLGDYDMPGYGKAGEADRGKREGSKADQKPTYDAVISGVMGGAGGGAGAQEGGM